MKNHIKLMLSTLAFVGFQAHGQLVQNGGFEDSPHSADWNFTAASTGSDFNYGSTGNFAHTGNVSANFGSTTPGTGLSVDDTITQFITTTPGDKYEVSYWLRTAGETGHVGVSGYAQFVSSFGGKALQNLHDPDPLFSYTEFTYDVEATSASSLLSFKGQCVDGWFNLDDVSVTDLGPASGVPDVASTFGLLGAALAGLKGLRRKLA